MDETRAERARLEALRRYAILDTAPERTFDDLARLASFICRTPIALVSLVDRDRQWFKARVGLDGRETPREHAFCAHAIQGAGLMVVPDATADARFATNPLVTDEPRIRFYAGAPLVTGDGHSLGTLCVIDRVPRELASAEREALEALARQVRVLLDLRETATALGEALAEAKVLRGLLPICAACKKIRDVAGVWWSVEGYVAQRTEAKFTHGICPPCVAELYPGLAGEAPS